eukprot:gene2691-biopygen2989
MMLARHPKGAPHRITEGRPTPYHSAMPAVQSKEVLDKVMPGALRPVAGRLPPSSQPWLALCTHFVGTVCTK